MIHSPQEGPAYTEDERRAAGKMSVTTHASLAESFSIVERCRGVGITPAEVMECAAQRSVSMPAAFDFLFRLEEMAGKILSEPIRPHERTAPSEGTAVHLRPPTNKAERRLIRDIQRAIKARDTVMEQLVRVNRAVATAERGLRLAGMITGGGS